MFPGTRTSWGHAAAAAVASLLFVIHSAWYARGWLDDAYITFRYSRNLWEGRGFVWNEGEHVEGITNLLWGLLLAPATSGDVLGWSKVAGLALTVATLHLLVDHVRWRGHGPGVALLAAAPLVVAPWAPMYAVTGMETNAVLFATTLAWSRFGRDAGFPWAALGATLAPLFRPDAALLSALLVGWRAATLRDRPWSAVDTRGALLLFGVGALTVVGKLVWFGDLLPNTLYAKHAPFPYTTGWYYAANFVWSHSPLFGLLLGAALARAGWVAAARLPAAVVVLSLGVGVWTGGDFFPNYRFFVPGLAAVGALVVAASPWRAWLAPVLLAVSLLPTLPLDQVRGAQRPPGLWGFEGTTTTKSALPWGEASPLPLTWLSGNPFPPAFLLAMVPDGVTAAYSDIGLSGYVNDHAIVDLFGLTDPVFARGRGRSPKEQQRYLLDRAGVVILRTRGEASVFPAVEAALAEAPGWRLVMAARPHRVYARDDAWTLVPTDVIEARLARLAERAPRHAGLLRQVYELVGLVHADVDFSAVDGQLLAGAGARGVAAPSVREAQCWGRGACAGLRRASWFVERDLDALRFVPPEGADAAHVEAYLSRVRSLTGKPGEPQERSPRARP